MSKKITKTRLKSIERKALKSKKRFKTYITFRNTIRRKEQKRKRSRSGNTKPFVGPQNDLKRIVKVPAKFSIGGEIEAVLKFIYDNKKLVEYKRVAQIIFDFSNVVEIDDGASTILLSFCYDMTYKKIRVGINYLPRADEARAFMEQSGFIKYFSGPLARPTPGGLNTTIKKGKSTILQKDSALLIHNSMKTVCGEDKRNQKLQGMLIELMTNSVNHAYLSNEREKSWYISTKHDVDQNKVEYCFVDNGDGIINTINVKFKDKLFTSNEDLLKRAFEGEFRSRTKLANRGKGLIVVKNNHINMTIKGLKVITNNVFLDFDSNTAIKLKNPFSGTFYSWIIDKTCK
jgi:anti-sigma regulatory factor (Ser/Thr protein kinase)